MTDKTFVREEDPLVMYIVVRRSLKLSPGKVGAQCGHAVDYRTRETEVNRRRLTHYNVEPTEEESQRLKQLDRWRYSPHHTKIVLGATDEEFAQVKSENPEHFLVVDFGYTEVAPNTETAVGLWPMRKSQRSPILCQLKPL